MHRLETAILETFKQDPSKSFSTTELVHTVFKQEFANLNPLIHSTDRNEQRRGYILKAKLHRKLLYHVDKLERKGVLAVDGVKGKGEKLLRLALEEGELVVQEQQKRIIIAKPNTITTSIDGYEKDGLLRKYRGESWMTKQQSILLDCNYFQNLATLQARLQHSLPLVNDIVALQGFEALLEKSSQEEVERFLGYLLLDSHDYDVAIALLLDIPSSDDVKEKILWLSRLLLDKGWNKRLTPVYTVTPRAITKWEQYYKALFALSAERRAKLHLKNAGVFSPPLYFGRAGTYAVGEDEWAFYKSHLQFSTDGFLVCGLSVAIDLGWFFEGKHTPSEFREMCGRISHAFFEIEEKRRKYMGEANGLVPANEEGRKDFFRVGKHYIRLWNYEWGGEYPLPELLESTEEELSTFSRTEETIFKSCGLPIRFAVQLSTSFAKFDQDFFSERRYRKTVVGSLKDLQTKEMTAYLRTRERLFKTFRGADRLRFFFSRSTALEEIMQAARYLLRAYDFPTFTFDFHGKAGELKLTTFLEE